MEKLRGSKRRGLSPSTSWENIKEQDKKAFKTVTPSWIPHATVNQPAHQRANESASKALEHEERVRSISSSQREFAAQFSTSAKSGVERQRNAPATGNSRWVSKPGRTASTAPLKSPGGIHGPATESHEKAGMNIPATQGARESREKDERRSEPHDRRRASSMEGSRNIDGVRQRGGGERQGDENKEKSTARCQAEGALVKGPWTTEEDQIIIDCINEKMTRWSEIAERVEGRVGKQCRERWFNHLDPTLKKSSWTPEEDEILVQGQARFGNSWTKIAKLLPGRSENAVKNRWNSAARKKSTTSSQRRVSEWRNVAMPSEARTGGQMQYVMMPSARHMNPQLTPAAAPMMGTTIPIMDMPRSPTCLLQHCPGIMPIYPLHGMPVQQQWPSQQIPLLESSRFPGSNGLQELHARLYGRMALAQQMYGQPFLLQPVFSMPPPVPLTAEGLSQQPFPVSMAAPSIVAATGPDYSVRECPSGTSGASGVSIAPGAVTETAFAEASAGSLQSPAQNGQPQPLSETEMAFNVDDELALANTLLSLSLEEQANVGAGFSGGRQVWGRRGQLNEFDVLRGFGTYDVGLGSAHMTHNGKLDGSVSRNGVLPEGYHRKEATDSSQLLQAPVRPQQALEREVGDTSREGCP
ncbi:MYB [Ectocarpus sp. CCAP 1310/34]|nr:MYB [Ectocarpus sp. CCAP 1310/34]